MNFCEAIGSKVAEKLAGLAPAGFRLNLLCQMADLQTYLNEKISTKYTFS